MELLYDRGYDGVCDHTKCHAKYQGLQEDFCRAEQDCLGPRGHSETSIKIEDLRSNKTTGKQSYMIYSCAAECPDNISK